ncbi:MAG TPA: amidohydrolase family protein [Spirillospora sp.]
MKDGMFVFDAAVHTQDFTDRQAREERDLQSVRALRNQIKGFTELTASKGGPPPFPGFVEPVDLDWANKVLFEESDTDVAMACSVPLYSHWKAGLGPVELAHELAASNPSRIYFTGGVDPSWQGLDFALEEMERQVREWGAVSFKFYQYQDRDHYWRADDREIAYPLWEKALELGIKMVQFHKGLPLGLQPVEYFRPNDIQLAAKDFPELNFGVHHLGDPYVDELISIASRFENVYLILPLWFNQYFLQPWPMLHRLGQALLLCGDTRICYGSEAFIWPHVQAYIDALATMEMPEELQERYGYPELTRTTKERIFGLNFAEGLGIDVESKKRELGLTSDA